MFNRRTDFALEQDDHGRFLPWLIAFMVFLAVLAMAGTFVMNGLAASWDRNMSGTLTVQIPAAGTEKQDKRHLAVALKILRGIPGIAEARPVPAAEMMNLLEPWLGQVDSISGLPLPQLIDVTLIPDADIDMKALTRGLTRAVPKASVDDHRVWLERFLRLIEAARAIAFSILALIGLATVGTVVFTTRTGLAVHQEAIEVLHLIGAQDSYIARQFATRALILAFRGGVIGLALGIPSLIVLGFLSAAMDTGVMPKLSLNMEQWLIIGSVPVLSAVLAMVTARFTVMKSLSRML